MREFRPVLREAERLMREGIELIRSDENARAEKALLRAREEYGRLAEEAPSKAIRFLARERRIHSRIDRILRALHGEAEVEYFDVLDERGRRTGRREASTLAHLRGTRHASLVVVFLNRAGMTLLQLRSAGLAIFPGRWTFAATGHVSSGQDSRAAARQEIIEEIAAPFGAGEEARLREKFPAAFSSEEEGSQWLRFAPSDQRLIRVGGENVFDSSLLLAEFVYWDEEERVALEKEIRHQLSGQPEGGIGRVVHDRDAPSHTLSVFTFDAARREETSRVVAAIEAKTGIPAGIITDNVEKRSLYLYRVSPDEEALLEGIITLKKRAGATIGSTLTTAFEWKPLDRVAREFNAAPERYSDGFVPFLSDPSIVAQMGTKGRL